MPDFASLNIISILPMLVIVLGALGILCLDMILGKFYQGIYVALSVIIIALGLFSLLYMDSYGSGFFDFVEIDGFSVVAQIIILSTSIFFVLLSKGDYREFRYAEFYALFLFVIAGYQFMSAASNLMLIFIALEASSLALYAMIALNRTDKGLEAALKYFTLGAFGSGLFAFGLVFIYASVGSLDIADLAFAVSTAGGDSKFLLLGFVFLLGALGFKLSFVPFHSWVPDIYEGSNPPLAFYMSVATKIAAFIVALRIFGIFLEFAFAQVILFIIVALTTTIPNIIALRQSDVQRMLAYSSISQAGFGLACIVVGTEQSVSALFLYWILFAFSNLGAFGLLWVVHNKKGAPFERFSGLIKTAPLLAICFAVFMLSLGGIPPFGLFWGKIFVISSAINSGHIALAIILLLNSAIAIYYYMKLIIFMFLKDSDSNILSPKDSAQIAKSTLAITTIIALSFIVCLVSLLLLGTILSHLGQFLGF
ncbi:NADH-quinone oxidoreductase subunit NuoN [Helicobacter sp. 23-1044]